MKRLAIVLALVLVMISVSSVFAQEGTIADVLTGKAGEGEFTVLLAAVQIADPAVGEALAGDEALTVFAPTDAAFLSLDEFVIEYLLSNPDLLTQVALYHVVPGAVSSADLAGMTSVASLDMGNELTIAADDMGISVDQAHVLAEMSDIEASNGVIHVIDSVLVPPITLPEVEPGFVTGNLNSAGSSTVGPLTEAIADDFIAAGYTGNYTNAIIGSGAGFERFCVAGETDFSNASRAIKDSEVESCNSIGRVPIEFRVGTDAISVVTNPANDFATDVTMDELALIFSTAETWADVRSDWPAEPIIRYYPGTDSGTFDYFVEEVFDEDKAPLLNSANSNPNENDDVLVAGVEDNPYAVGFFGYAYYIQNADRLNILSLDGIEPIAANVDNNSYPLARPLFVYSDAGIIAEKPQVGQFLSYYLNAVPDVIREVGYFPPNPFEFNIAKLKILALTDGDSGM